jgi:hypothetical protein
VKTKISKHFVRIGIVSNPDALGNTEILRPYCRRHGFRAKIAALGQVVMHLIVQG